MANNGEVGRYVADLDLEAYAAMMHRRFPGLARTLWLERPGAAEMLARLRSSNNEFESDAAGRGDSYRRAQQDLDVRGTGIGQLLDVAHGGCAWGGDDVKILDVLGGDGLIARYVERAVGSEAAHRTILTGDIAEGMVAQALRYGLPAVRQPAQFLLERDGTYDAVIMAYGVHHIPPEERRAAFAEAHRVLKPSGRLIVHDFERDSPMAAWFGDVVHRYSREGHDYCHFEAAALRDGLREAGFAEPVVGNMYDPFIVRDPDGETAHRRLMDYVLDMYGLVKLDSDGGRTDDTYERVARLCRQHATYDRSHVPGWGPHWKTELTLERVGDLYQAELPRVALVATAVR